MLLAQSPILTPDGQIVGLDVLWAVTKDGGRFKCNRSPAAGYRNGCRKPVESDGALISKPRPSAGVLPARNYPDMKAAYCERRDGQDAEHYRADKSKIDMI